MSNNNLEMLKAKQFLLQLEIAAKEEEIAVLMEIQRLKEENDLLRNGVKMSEANRSLLRAIPKENAAKQSVSGKSAGPGRPRGEFSPLRVIDILQHTEGAMERGLLKIYSYQLPSEREVHGHWVRNGRGFSKKHIKEANRFVAWIRGGANGFRLCTGHHRTNATNLALSYAKQMAEIASEEGSLAFLLG